METKIIILKLKEEQSKLLKQMEEIKCPLLTEVIVQGINRINAIEYMVPLLQQGMTNFGSEREYLIAQIKGCSAQSMPVDIVQVIHRLQVIYYVKTILAMEDKE